MPSPADSMMEIYGAPQLAQSFGVSVAVMRGGVTSGQIPAEVSTREERTFKAASETFQYEETREYIIAREHYPHPEPRKGDVIIEVIGGRPCRFVVHPTSDRPEYGWADMNGTRWLIRTKKEA